jgi:hypothetical protein
MERVNGKAQCVGYRPGDHELIPTAIYRLETVISALYDNAYGSQCQRPLASILLTYVKPVRQP